MMEEDNLYIKLINEYGSINISNESSESDLNLSEIFTKELKPDTNDTNQTSEIELTELPTETQKIKLKEPEKTPKVNQDNILNNTQGEIKKILDNLPIAIPSNPTSGLTTISTPPNVTSGVTIATSQNPISGLTTIATPPLLLKKLSKESIILQQESIAEKPKSEVLDVPSELKEKPKAKLPPTLLSPSLQLAFKGGSSNLEYNIFTDKQPTLKYIVSYYYKNYKEKIDNQLIPKILNNNEIIMIITACFYAFFINKKFNTIDEIINIEFISSIPKHVTYNFIDLITLKLKSNKNYNDIQKYIDDFSIQLKKKVYSNIYNKDIDIEYDPKNYKINIYLIEEFKQEGGKVNVNNQIKNKIEKLSTYLKNTSKQFD